MEVVKEYRFLGRKVGERCVKFDVPVEDLNRREVPVGNRLPGSIFFPQLQFQIQLRFRDMMILLASPLLQAKEDHCLHSNIEVNN